MCPVYTIYENPYMFPAILTACKSLLAACQTSNKVHCKYAIEMDKMCGFSPLKWHFGRLFIDIERTVQPAFCQKHVALPILWWQGYGLKTKTEQTLWSTQPVAGVFLLYELSVLKGIQAKGSYPTHMHCVNVIPIWFFSTLSYATLIEPLKITQTYLNYISNAIHHSKLHSFWNNIFLRIPGNAARYPVGTRSTQWMTGSGLLLTCIIDNSLIYFALLTNILTAF